MTTSSSGTGFTITYGNTAPTWAVPPPLPDHPVLRGRGPVEFSTCTEVAKSPMFVWDVNGYYRDLHCPTDATRKMLRLAYMSLGGPNNHRLTYVFKQLLNPEVRRAYDRMPLGQPFMDDYVREEISRRAKEAAVRAANVARQKYGKDLDPDDLFKDIAVQMAKDDGWDISFEDLDNDANDDEAEQPRIYHFAFYQWKSNCDDTDRLIEWQELLVRAFAERGVKEKIALGFLGRMPHRVLLGKVGYRLVVFLHEEQEPNAEYAAMVAETARVEQDKAASNSPPSREIEV